MSGGDLNPELNGDLGMRAITEIVISKQGINNDDVLLAKACHYCGRLFLNARSTDITDLDNYRIMIRTPDARMYVLRGSELLTAECGCGHFYTIVIYGPAELGGAGYFAHMTLELNGLSDKLTGVLRDMRKWGDQPPDVDEWVARETLQCVQRAVRQAGRNGFSRVSDDWCESKYCSGWIQL